MGEFLRDPELDQLVQEMNRLDSERNEATGEEAALVDAPRLREVRTGEPLQTILAEMLRSGASDLLLVPGSPPVLRINGRLQRAEAAAVEADDIRALFAGHLGARSQESLNREGSADFSLRLQAIDADAVSGGCRLRVNLHRQRGELSAAVRALPQRVPALHELNLPDSLIRLVDRSHGLVLVCGPTGVGKSTTLAAMVDVLNRGSSRHVIAIEEPIEYEHSSQHSIVEQVEVGSDAPSFAHALRSALRCDPDVILVGEMRDLETIATALTAAETGHLILSTLHTSDVAQAVHRMVDVFPAEQQAQIRHQLALSLSAIVCQQLVPLANGKGRVPALEVMVATNAIRNHIRKGALHHLYNEIGVGRNLGMCSMEESLTELVRVGLITADEARVRAPRPDELERLLAG